ncbi:Trm112 family protein [Brachybacterium sp. AOP25-B2-12]|uniref:Trm112 family protein n=1 Tax=Brachybacterium sp. AOP25-B2-12 TaxID=3457710 RepID=UPI004033998E
MSEARTAGPVTDLGGLVKAYDVRGVADVDLTEDVARALGAAFADHVDAGRIVVAHDMRVSSPRLSAAFAEGAVQRGGPVEFAGLSSTDQLYCASGLLDAAGAMFTASHNPAPDNGIKLCLSGARPISRDTGLTSIRTRAEAYLRAGTIARRPGGSRTDVDTLPGYVETVLRLAPVPDRRPLRVVVDAADAMASLTVPAVAEHLPSITVVPVHFGLDGTFPHHEANPLDPKNLRDLQDAVRAEGADLGLAFDGDADRCVVVDEQGRIVPPSAVTALIATREIARARAAGEETPVVIANLVSSRHVQEAIEAAGGRRVRSRVGHSLIKALMAQDDAVFGGEHSAHYYFRDFFSADSGMLAALHVLAALAETDGTLSALVAEHDPYAASGELNRTVADAAAATAAVRAHLDTLDGVVTDDLDGLTAVHWDEEAPAGDRWWLSLRSSNTEPLLRLNVEAAEEGTMHAIRDRVLALVGGSGSTPAEQTPAGPAARAGTPTDSDVVTVASGADVPGWVRAALRCPVCRHELRDAEAALRCTGCDRLYPVENGIPVLIAERALEG